MSDTTYYPGRVYRFLVGFYRLEGEGTVQSQMLVEAFSGALAESVVRTDYPGAKIYRVENLGRANLPQENQS